MAPQVWLWSVCLRVFFCSYGLNFLEVLPQYMTDDRRLLLAALDERLSRVIGLKCVKVIPMVIGCQWLSHVTT